MSETRNPSSTIAISISSSVNPATLLRPSARTRPAARGSAGDGRIADIGIGGPGAAVGSEAVEGERVGVAAARIVLVGIAPRIHRHLAVEIGAAPARAHGGVGRWRHQQLQAFLGGGEAAEI